MGVKKQRWVHFGAAWAVATFGPRKAAAHMNELMERFCPETSVFLAERKKRKEKTDV